MVMTVAHFKPNFDCELVKLLCVKRLPATRLTIAGVACGPPTAAQAQRRWRR